MIKPQFIGGLTITLQIMRKPPDLSTVAFANYLIISLAFVKCCESAIWDVPSRMVDKSSPFFFGIVSEVSPYSVGEFVRGPVSVVEHLIVPFQPNFPYCCAPKQRPDGVKLFKFLGDVLGPYEFGSTAWLCWINLHAVENQNTPLPYLYSLRAIPKSM